MQKSKKHQPKIAFVTVDYMSKNNTLRLLDSLNRIKEKFEVVLIDNSNSFGKVKRYKFPLRIFRQKKNKGWTGGVNVALRYLLKRKFDYMFTINNDSIVKHDILKRMMETAGRGASQIGARIHDIPTGKYTSGYKKAWHTWLTGQFVENERAHLSKEPIKLGKWEFVDDCACFYDLNIFRRIGLYDESIFLYWEDADIGMRIKEWGDRFQIWYNPKAVVYHRGHGSSEGGKSPIVLFYMTRNRILFMAKYFRHSFPFFFLFFVFIQLPLRILNDTRNLKKPVWKWYWYGLYSAMTKLLFNFNIMLKKNLYTSEYDLEM